MVVEFATCCTEKVRPIEKFRVRTSSKVGFHMIRKLLTLSMWATVCRRSWILIIVTVKRSESLYVMPVLRQSRIEVHPYYFIGVWSRSYSPNLANILNKGRQFVDGVLSACSVSLSIAVLYLVPTLPPA